MSRVYAVVLGLVIASAAAAVTAADEAAPASAVEAVPFVDPASAAARIDPADTACGTAEQRVAFAFELETEVADPAVANATGNAIALKLVTSNVTLNGCRYTAPVDAAKPKAEPLELITVSALFTADECKALIDFAESHHLFAGRRAPLSPLSANASDAEKAAYAAAAAAAAATPVPDAASGYVNESLAHEFGLALEPLEDRIAAWLNVSVEELEYFQITKLTADSAFSKTPFQYSPSRDIDYTNSRYPLSADDLLIADAIQHHRIASVFVFLSADDTAASGWSQFPALNARVQPRVGSALYWPSPSAPAVEYNGSDAKEAEAAVAAVTPAPLVHVAEPTTTGAPRYGLNVWVYPNVWRGDVEDDIDEEDVARATAGLAGADDSGDDSGDDEGMTDADDDDAFFDDEDGDDELREFDAEDDEDLDRAEAAAAAAAAAGGGAAAAGDESPEVDVAPGKDDGDKDGDADDEPPRDGDEDDFEGEVDGDDDGGDDDGGAEEDDNPFLQYMSDAELNKMAEKQEADAKAKDDKAAPAAAAAGAGDAKAHVHTEL